MMSVHLISLVLFVVVGSSIVHGAPTKTGSDVSIPKHRALPRIINNKYPLTKPIVLPDGSVKYRIGLVSDLDGDSVNKNETNTWISYFKRGYLTYNNANRNVFIEWDAPTEVKRLESHLSVNGRGMELSELVTYNGELITLDDRTGLVYIIEDDVLIPWVIVVDGNGREAKGLKTEWATVKDSKLYVGSHGKESVSDDGLRKVGGSMMWVKAIDADGRVEHLDWTENYTKLRAAAGVQFPGYMIHESCVWSDVHGRWFFLPRKESAEPFDREADERRATNKLLAATPDFDDVKITNVGDLIPNHGYASFKFIPHTKDTIITAISTQEEGDTTATFITAFTIHGEIIYPETKVSDLKFEGFEFI